MNNFTLSQTEPISSLPRDYANLIERAKRSNQPIIFLKRNRPVGGLLGWKLLNKLMKLKAEVEKKEALANILQSEKEYRGGKAKVLRSLSRLG